MLQLGTHHFVGDFCHLFEILRRWILRCRIVLEEMLHILRVSNCIFQTSVVLQCQSRNETAQQQEATVVEYMSDEFLRIRQKTIEEMQSQRETQIAQIATWVLTVWFPAAWPR